MTPQSAAALAAFNLVCSGMETSGTDADRNNATLKQIEFTEVYRVDLQQGRWCKGACTETRAIATVTDTEIELEKSNVEALSLSARTAVSRESGHYISVAVLGDISIFRDGECHKADFTGFPTRKF